MLVRIVGLGPGDPGLLTLGSLDALRASERAIVLLAPGELTSYLQAQGVNLAGDLIPDPALFVRGSTDAIESFARVVTGKPKAQSAGVLSNAEGLSKGDFAT